MCGSFLAGIPTKTIQQYTPLPTMHIQTSKVAENHSMSVKSFVRPPSHWTFPFWWEEKRSNVQHRWECGVRCALYVAGQCVKIPFRPTTKHFLWISPACLRFHVAYCSNGRKQNTHTHTQRHQTNTWASSVFVFNVSYDSQPNAFRALISFARLCTAWREERFEFLNIWKAPLLRWSECSTRPCVCGCGCVCFGFTTV